MDYAGGWGRQSRRLATSSRNVLRPGRRQRPLKLPADFHKYLTESGAVKVFVTSFDKRIGKIYPIPVWKEIETRLEAGNGNGRKGKALLFVANDLGGDAEVDGARPAC